MYAVVSAVRIHEWVARTPQLPLIRGASEALRRQTSRLAVEPLLPAGVRWCVAAGEVSGVVPLEASDAVAAESAVTRVAAHLRVTLPALQLDSWWVASPDYVTAFDLWSSDTLAGSTSPKVERRLFLPAPLDVPMIESCGLCRQEPVDVAKQPVQPRDRQDVPVRAGRDCQTRLDHESGAPNRAAVGRFAKDFDELARRGGVGSDGRRRDTPTGRTKDDNHLATICADGNAVGGLMQFLARPGPLDPQLSQIVQDLRDRLPSVLDSATNEAVRRATEEISGPGQQVQPVAVHVLGGDDIVVSVPAPLAWRFVATLFVAFADEMDRGVRDGALEQLKELGGKGAELVRGGETRAVGDNESAARIRDALLSISLGAGMTFAHASHPYADTSAQADRAMGRAKGLARGRRSAVYWTDVTQDARGTEGLFLTEALLVEQIAHPRRVPSALTLSRSAAAALGQILSDEWGGSSDATRISAASREIRRWARRTAVSGLPGTLDEPTGASAVVDLRELRAQLSRARWWPQQELTA